MSALRILLCEQSVEVDLRARYDRDALLVLEAQFALVRELALAAGERMTRLEWLPGKAIVHVAHWRDEGGPEVDLAKACEEVSRQLRAVPATVADREATKLAQQGGSR